MSTPTWGLVTAEPHQHLIQIRRGRVVASHQGGSCFRWPGDTVAVVDTSVRRLQFTADQVTREKVGVQVTGLAVLRIVEPLLAWRTLDLSDSGYLTILEQMFVGATRRLVANLALEQCLTRRKDALATELMAEVAPVVQGSGRPDDRSDRGWGIAIDTIEVQDVRVLSNDVFRNLQAPYRESLELEALKARAAVEAEQVRLVTEQEQQAERDRQAQMELEVVRIEVERQREREAAEHRGRLEDDALQARLARKQREAEARLATAEVDARRQRLEAEVEADRVRIVRQAQEGIGPERLQELLLTETLPSVASAWAESMGEVTVYGGDFGFLGAGLEQAMALLDRFKPAE